MLGALRKRRMNGIKDSCFKCSTFHATAVKTTMNCTGFKSYFIKWDNRGYIEVGDGTDITKDKFLHYQSTTKISVNILNVMSQKANVTWRFRVEDTVTDKVGQEIFEIKAFDPESDKITYSLGRKAQDMFKLNGSSLMLKKMLDYEKQSFYSIEISITDGFNTVPASMAVQVTDVNDEPPTLSYNDEVKVPEEMPVGYVISGLFSATDKDMNDTMTFMLEGPESEFLNLSNNVLRVQRRIDHDGNEGHFSLNGLTFRVMDSLNHESNITKNITIMDVNDNTPKFPQYIYNLNITENSTRETFLIQLSATDNDYGGNGHVVYSLAGENDTTKYFKLNGTDLFVNGDEIDLETMKDGDDELMLTVMAVDTPEFEQPQTGSATIRLKIISKNEYDPVWSSPKLNSSNAFPDMTLSEDAAPLTRVVIVTAKDEDKGEDGMIGYSISSVTTASGVATNNTFWIDVKTGELKTAAILDSDTGTGGEEYYDLQLTAADTGNPSRNTTASMRIRISNVNDNPPSFNNTVNEIPLTDNMNKGDVVAFLRATDADGDKMTFTLGGQYKDLFEYDGKTIKAAKTVASGKSYVLILRASDGVHKVAATAIIGSDQSNSTVGGNTTGSGGTGGAGAGAGKNGAGGAGAGAGGAGAGGAGAGGAGAGGAGAGGAGAGGVGAGAGGSGGGAGAGGAGGREAGGAGSAELVLEPRNDFQIPEEYPVGLPLPSPFSVLGGGKNNTLTFELSGDDSALFDIEPISGVMKLKERVDFESNTTKTFLDSLKVTVTDSASKKKEANITIKFIDINDNEPEFHQKLITANATENSTKHLLVAQLTYSDLDRGPNGNVTLQISSTSPLYSLEGDKLYVDGTQLDYEDGNISHYQHTVVIQAVDNPQSGPAKTGQTVVVVKIVPDNEFAPVWSQPDIDSDGSFPNKSLFGVDTPLAEVGTFIATDQDGGEDGQLVYSLTSAVTENGENVTGAFTVDPLTGVVLTTVHVDSGAKTASSYFDVVVAVADKGTPPRTTEGKIRVNIDVTQTVSKLTKTARFVSQFVAKVAEDAAVGDVVKNFTGAFPGAEKTDYTVTGKWNDTFEFDGLNLKVKKQLDYESTRIHFVDIRISDGSKDETAVMAVRVNDLPDEAPKIEILSSSVPEELPPASVVGRLFKVTDGDQNDSLTYKLTGDHAKYFDINAETGVLSVKEKLNRDGKDGIQFLDQLMLTVTDRAGLTTNSSLNLTVLDMNDNIPTLSNGGLDLNITENSTSDTILTSLTCEDPDEGQNGNCSVELKTDLTSIFKMKGSDLTADGSLIDYEGLSDQQFIYKVIVVTSDHPDGGQPHTSSITVDVKELSGCPGFVRTTPPYYNGQQRIFKELKTDGSGKLNMINLLGVPVGGTDHLLFEAKGGQAFIILSESNTFTSEKGRYYCINLGFRSKDGKQRNNGIKYGCLKCSIFHAAGLDNPPVFAVPSPSGSTIINVHEDSPANKTLLSFLCEDPEGDDIKYTVKSHVDLFYINNASLILTRQLDYEKQKHYTIKIEAFDGLYTVPVTLSVNVIDVNDETPVLIFGDDLWIPEEMPIGTIVGGLFKAVDADPNDNLTYTLRGEGTVYINFTNNVLRITDHIDRDLPKGPHSFSNMTFVVEDSGSHQVKSVRSLKILDINDNFPSFEKNTYQLSVGENSTSHQLLTSIRATDADEGPNGDVTLTLKIGDDLVDFFHLEGTDLYADGDKIDFEKLGEERSVLKFSVEGSDAPLVTDAKTSTASIYVSIVPKNEYDPAWTSPEMKDKNNFKDISVLENITVLSEVAVFKAGDDDIGVDGHVQYRLASASSGSDLDVSDCFILHPTNGVLKTARLFDSDTAGMDQFTLVLEAADTGTNTRTATGTLVLQIGNVNDNDPAFKNTVEDVDLSNDMVPGSTVATITAEDADNDTISYSVLGRDKDLFEYSDSQLKAKKKLSKGNSYFIELRASDGIHVTSCAVSIHGAEGDSQNKSDSVYVSAKSNVRLPEEIPAGFPIPRLFVAMGTDSAKNITYSVTGEDGHFFAIHPDTGEMSVAERIDADNGTRLVLDKLTVKVDRGGGVVKTANLTVTIEDINDNTPLFEQSVYFVNVTENSTRTSLVNLTCTDGDSGANSDITMYITDGDKSIFDIEDARLMVDGTKVDYDINGDAGYTVTVHAVDSPRTGEPRTGATVILVKVLPRNEFAPSWKMSNGTMATPLTDVHLAKDTDVGTIVSVMAATDQDLGEDGKVSYFLDNVTSDAGRSFSSIFSVAKGTGILKTESPFLDGIFRDVKHFTLELRVADNGRASKEARALMKIILDPPKVDAGPKFCESVFELSVLENSTLGFLLLNLSITWSGGGNHTLEIEEQTALNQSERLFGFENETLLLLKGLDYEMTRVHVLTVRATDGQGSSTTRVIVHVEDVIDEPPVIIVNKHNSLPEELPHMTIVGSLFSVTDADFNDTLHYALTGADSQYFAIQSTTGLLGVYKTMNCDGPDGIKVLDNITLVVTDSSGLTTSANLSVHITNVNDNSPTLGKDSFYVGIKENSPKDTELLSLNVSDADVPDSKLTDFQIIFGTGNELGIFAVNGNVITVNGELIDCESTTSTKKQYVLPVLVRDSDPYGKPRVGGSFIFVNVIPVNEYTPVWLLPVNTTDKIYLNKTLLDSDDIGTIVSSVEATDEDWGEDGIVQYEILSVVDGFGNNVSGLFQISARTGTLLLDNSLLGVASGTTYNITFQAHDRGDPPKSIEGEIRVYVESSNRPPRFLQGLYQFDIPEDTPLHQPLLNLTVFDLENGNLTFNVTNDEKELFTFVGANLVLTSSLDFEDDDGHMVTVWYVEY
ncbi:fat-like cadherin-related tumor suppressor homolog [Haliotis asinina]|uniref:fat-like cadherin-related tumor suppressor homolog n=1 Tax=Haliotis asinina TaxID=109174 RepID=UPI003532158D